MSTRFKTDAKRNYGQAPLQSGYEQNGFGTHDLTIPACGVEDVDVALFKLFDKEIVAHFGGIDGAELKKVPVVFAAGEKWALLKRGRPIRDKTNTLLLPLITIMRTELNQSATEDVAGRGINQQVGEMVVRRRLDKSDRNYQALLNKLLLPNQPGLSASVPGQPPTTDRSTGSLSGDKAVKDGAYLTPNLKNNVYETIVVPMPQFYTAKYQVTIWTQYTQHANQILETIFSSFLPQGQCWRLDTEKGYWFVAKVEDASFATETNFEDMSQQERYIKHTFNIAVPAYFFSSKSPGAPVALKRYVSSPDIVFTVDSSAGPSFPEDEDGYVIGSDDPTLPLSIKKNNRDDQQKSSNFYPVHKSVYEPATLTEAEAASISKGYTVKVLSTNSKGETVYSGAALGGLEIIVTK